MKNILKTNIFFFILLFIIIFLVYAKAVNFKITNLDDNSLITRNIIYISDYKNIPAFFLTDCYFGKKTQYYRPMLNVSFSLEAIFFGDNFKIYHLTNIFLFFLSLYLIFVFLSKLNFNKTVLKFLIIFFAVHPIFSSVPVWIPARNDTLLTVFFISSLIFFIKYLNTNKLVFFLLHMFFFCLALFTKETSLLLLLIYPLLAYCFNFKFSKKQLFYNLSFLIPLLVVYFILRTNAVRTVDLSMYITNWHYYLKNIIFGIMIYIEKLIFPTYMPIMLFDFSPALQTYIINIIFFTFLIYVYRKKIIERKLFLFSTIFFFISVFPTFMQKEYALLFHRLIVGLPAIIILSCIILQKLILKYPITKKYLIILFCFFTILFSICSFNQIDKYKNGFSFWYNAYNDANNYYLTCSGLAKQHIYAGNHTKAKELFYKSKKIKNTYETDLDIVTVLIAEGNIKQAKERLLRLLNLKENFTALRYLSEICYIEGDIENSYEYAKRAYNIDKNDENLLKHIKKLPFFDYNI